MSNIWIMERVWTDCIDCECIYIDDDTIINMYPQPTAYPHAGHYSMLTANTLLHVCARDRMGCSCCTWHVCVHVCVRTCVCVCAPVGPRLFQALP